MSDTNLPGNYSNAWTVLLRRLWSRSGIEGERIDPGYVEDGETQRFQYKAETTKKLHCHAKSRSSMQLHNQSSIGTIDSFPSIRRLMSWSRPFYPITTIVTLRNCTYINVISWFYTYIPTSVVCRESNIGYWCKIPYFVIWIYILFRLCETFMAYWLRNNMQMRQLHILLISRIGSEAFLYW